jgi:hypothetical protein
MLAISPQSTLSPSPAVAEIMRFCVPALSLKLSRMRETSTSDLVYRGLSGAIPTLLMLRMLVLFIPIGVESVYLNPTGIDRKGVAFCLS